MSQNEGMPRAITYEDKQSSEPIKLPKLEGLIKLVNQDWEVRKKARENDSLHGRENE